MQEKLSEATLSRQGKEKAAHAIIKTLDDIEEEHRVTVSQLQGEIVSLCYLRSNFTPEQITECVKAIAKCEAKHTHLAKEVGRIKAEKELRVRNLIAKAHKERDATMKLEKRLRSKVYLCLGLLLSSNQPPDCRSGRAQRVNKNRRSTISRAT